MDAEDLVTSALEPGEKIVWSDRPHVDFWLGASRRTPLQIVWLGIVWLVWLFFVVQALSFALMPVGPNPRVDSPRNIGRVELAVLTLIALLEVAWRVSTMLRHGKIRYTVTDRQRLIDVDGEHARAFPLPSSESITTRATGADEFGDVLVDAITLCRVSYPLIAVESIRSVAESHAPRSDTA